MLVGREAELAELDRALARMLGGQGALVLVGGEPGAGKTALVAAGPSAAPKHSAISGSVTGSRLIRWLPRMSATASRPATA